MLNIQWFVLKGVIDSQVRTDKQGGKPPLNQQQKKPDRKVAAGPKPVQGAKSKSAWKWGWKWVKSERSCMYSWYWEKGIRFNWENELKGWSTCTYVKHEHLERTRLWKSELATCTYASLQLIHASIRRAIPKVRWSQLFFACMKNMSKINHFHLFLQICNCIFYKQHWIILCTKSIFC